MQEGAIGMDKNELNLATLTWEELTCEFSEQCRKFEKWVEQRYEFDEHNRSIRNGVRDGIIEKLGTLAYAIDKQKLKRHHELFAKSNNSYDAQNKYDDFLKKESSVKSSSFFLAKQVYYELTLKNGREPVTSKGDIDRLVRNKIEYLPDFFGVEYKQDEWSEEQWFQIHQLLLILYRCANIKNKILDGMRKGAIWRFQDKSENPYQEGINFIRRELLKGISFSDAFAIERYAGTIRHAVHSMADGIVLMIGNNRRNTADLPIEEIQNDLYPLILKNLKKLNKEESRKACFDSTNDLFWRAYLHFLLLGIEDTSSTPYLKLEPQVIDSMKRAHKSFFQEAWSESKAANNQSGINQDTIKSDEVGVKIGDQIDCLERFIQNEAKIIVKKLWGKTDSKSIATMRRYNKKKIYLSLAKMYCRYNLFAEPHVIFLSELVGMVCLFHECIKQETADKFLVPRESAFKGGNKSRLEKQIFTIVSEIARDNKSVNYTFFFGDKEERTYEMECFMNTLTAILDNEPSVVMKYGDQIAKETRAYLLENVPLLDNVPRRYKDLHEIALSIFSVKEMENYCFRKEKELGMELFKWAD